VPNKCLACNFILQSYIHHKSPNEWFRVLIDDFLGLVVAHVVIMSWSNHKLCGARTTSSARRVIAGPERMTTSVGRATAGARKVNVGVGKATIDVGRPTAGARRATSSLGWATVDVVQV